MRLGNLREKAAAGGGWAILQQSRFFQMFSEQAHAARGVHIRGQ